MTNSIVSANSSIEVSDHQGQLVVDSRVIALNLNIQHETVIKSIRKYAAKFQSMGNLRFEIGTSQPNANGAIHQVQFVYLNELQSNFLMTLSKNTDAVVECKFNLSIAFDKAKSIIKTVIPAQNDRIRELELEVRLAELRNNMVNTTSTLVTLHGEALGLAIAGFDGQVVEVKIPVTEVLNPVTGDCKQFLDAKQLVSEVQRRSGQKVKSNADFIRKLKLANRDDLILPVTRNATCEYVTADKLDEAIDVVYGKCKQQLLTPVQSSIA
jgi:phage regulator Rha-like protein